MAQGLWPQPRWIGCRHVDYHILKKLMFHRSRDSVSRLRFGCWVFISPFISLPFIDVHRYIITYLIHTLRSYECLGDRKEFRSLVIYTFSILNRDFSSHILNNKLLKDKSQCITRYPGYEIYNQHDGCLHAVVETCQPNDGTHIETAHFTNT